MEYNEEFTMRFFSNDCIDKFPDNTLSSFTTQFDIPLDFGGEFQYEVGVSQIFFNPTQDVEAMKTETWDSVLLSKSNVTTRSLLPSTDDDGFVSDAPAPPTHASSSAGKSTSSSNQSKKGKQTPATSSVALGFASSKKNVIPPTIEVSTSKPLVREMDLPTFIEEVLNSSLSPDMYNENYFQEYLDENIFYDPETLNKLFPKDRASFSKEEALHRIDVSVPVKSLFTTEMASVDLKDLQKRHLHVSNDIIEKFALIHIPVVTGKTLTMRQILNICLRYAIMHLRNNTKVREDFDLEGHGLRFFENSDKYRGIRDMQMNRISHLLHNNKITHLFVRKFVSLTLDIQHTKLMMKQRLEPTKFIFVYCDAIKNQRTGAKETKLLHISPFFSEIRKGYFHERITNIEYMALDKNKLKDISFLLLDENAEKINFKPSFKANYIALKFRRRRQRRLE